MLTDTTLAGCRDQRGVFLIEALIGILIFSIGILGMVALQTATITAQTDAQYRVEAADLTNQLISNMWLNVDRTSAATIQATVAAFAYNTSGTGCDFSGGGSTSPVVTAWVNAATTGATPLPGSTSAMQQILVDTSAGNYNKVTATLCWQTPIDKAPRKYTVITYVN